MKRFRPKTRKAAPSLPTSTPAPPPDSASHPPPPSPPPPKPYTELFSHDCNVNDIHLTPNGSFLALASDSPPRSSSSALASVRVYDCPSADDTSRQPSLRTEVFVHRSSSVLSVRLTADAALGFSSGHSGLVHVWDAVTGTERCALSPSASLVTVHALENSPLGDLCISGSQDTFIRIWDVHSQKNTRTIPATLPVSSLAYSSEANVIAATTRANTVALFDARIGRSYPVSTLIHTSAMYVSDCSITPDGRALLSCTEAGTVHLWDLRKTSSNNRQVQQFSMADDRTSVKLFGCSIAADCGRVLACGDRASLGIWDVMASTQPPDGASDSNSKPCAPRLMLEGHSPTARVRRCSLSANGETAASAGYDGTALLFRLPSVTRNRLAPMPGWAVDDPYKETETERLFYDYVNNGQTLKAHTVARAIALDARLKQYRRLSSIYVAHVVVRTVLGNGDQFEPDDLAPERNLHTFLYAKLYHTATELSLSTQDREFIMDIMYDARDAKLLSAYDINSIIGDVQVAEYSRELFSRVATVMRQVYDEVTQRVASLDARLENASEEIAQVASDVANVKDNIERAEKIQRYANLVKLGVAMVPIVGAAAMVVVDSSVDVVLSLDLEGALSTGLSLMQEGANYAVDRWFTVEHKDENNKDVGTVVISSEDEAIAAKDVVRSHYDERRAIAVLETALSDQFLNRLSKSDRSQLINGLESGLRITVGELRKQVSMIVSEFDDTQVVARTGGVGSTIAQEENNDFLLRHAFLEMCKEHGGHAVLSHGQACECIMGSALRGMRSAATCSVDRELKKTVASMILRKCQQEDDNIYCVVDEKLFVETAMDIVDIVKRVEQVEWEEHFKRASLGDSIIDEGVAKHVIRRLILSNLDGFGEDVETTVEQSLNVSVRQVSNDDGAIDLNAFLRVAWSSHSQVLATLI